MASDVKLTFRQRQVLDYMRGNGGRLDSSGCQHLKRRWGSTVDQGLTRVLLGLEQKGLIERTGLPVAPTELTEAGKRCS